MNKIKHITLVCFVLIIIIVFRYGPRWTGLSLSELLNYTPDSPMLASLFFLGLYCLKAFVVFIPLTVLYIAAGVIFPWWWALLLTYLCLAVEKHHRVFPRTLDRPPPGPDTDQPEGVREKIDGLRDEP